MSDHDFSGIDERVGRWWPVLAGALFLIGALIGLVVMAAAAGHALEN
jgi:hypothetical protein